MKRQKNRKTCHFAVPLNNYPSKSISIPFEIVELENCSFHIIIKVEVNGIKGDMIIDTGASVTVTDEKLFQDNNDHNSDNNANIKIQANSISGQINNTRMIKAQSFKSGKLNIKDMQLVTIDLDYVNDMYSKHLNRQVIGLLGCDFCVRHKVIINYRTKEILLNI